MWVALSYSGDVVTPLIKRTFLNSRSAFILSSFLERDRAFSPKEYGYGLIRSSER